ncbi:hypothetical protein GQX73_g6119 [Xylaria multiplex]|uniref:Uncharacterized protein n=1 Tax=Xylaria multiplex TaxID=323545 RepID=A0A7C8MWP8_9PEZI|nr:hypothetical protein GQX73_g6119 [Xylaria multiplex]
MPAPQEPQQQAPMEMSSTSAPGIVTQQPAAEPQPDMSLRGGEEAGWRDRIQDLYPFPIFKLKRTRTIRPPPRVDSPRVDPVSPQPLLGPESPEPSIISNFQHPLLPNPPTSPTEAPSCPEQTAACESSVPQADEQQPLTEPVALGESSAPGNCGEEPSTEPKAEGSSSVNPNDSNQQPSSSTALEAEASSYISTADKYRQLLSQNIPEGESDSSTNPSGKSPKSKSKSSIAPQGGESLKKTVSVDPEPAVENLDALTVSAVKRIRGLILGQLSFGSTSAGSTSAGNTSAGSTSAGTSEIKSRNKKVYKIRFGTKDKGKGKGKENEDEGNGKGKGKGKGKSKGKGKAKDEGVDKGKGVSCDDDDGYDCSDDDSDNLSWDTKQEILLEEQRVRNEERRRLVRAGKFSVLDFISPLNTIPEEEVPKWPNGS